MDETHARPEPPRRAVESRFPLPPAPAQRGSLEETREEAMPAAIAPARTFAFRRPEEMLPVWRRRLRLAALLLFAGFAAFLLRRVFHIFYLGLEPRSAAGWFLFWSHAAVTAILGLFGLLLSSRSPSTFTRLCAAELALFGFPTVLFAASQYFITLRACEEWHVFAFSSGQWLLLIFTYALFIPSTLRRAIIVIGGIVAAPMLLLLAMSLLHPAVASMLTADDLAGLALVFGLAAVGGAIGVGKIDSLRRDAFLATQLGQYRLKQRIGSGGMGEVFLAEHEMLKRPCVIKLIRRDKVGDEKVLARFHREVQATARLSHWNTVEIFDYGRTEEGTLFYVMEYLPGMSLAEMVERFGPLSPERSVYLLLQVCDALREAHQAGLVHHDIKPGNIFIAQRGGVDDVVKLLDFGLVKPISNDEPLHLTTEGMVTGSPLFMSPEQATGAAANDARSDIYSLGAVAYYMLTGRPPFSRDNFLQLVIAHAKEKPVPPTRHNPGIPSDIERIVVKCLSKDPSDRFQDVEELGIALAQCGTAGRWSRELAAQWWQERHGSGERRSDGRTP